MCPECQGRLRKVFNAVGVVFKGSGFYRTDSRSDRRQRAERRPRAAPRRRARHEVRQPAVRRARQRRRVGTSASSSARASAGGGHERQRRLTTRHNARCVDPPPLTRPTSAARTPWRDRPRWVRWTAYVAVVLVARSSSAARSSRLHGGPPLAARRRPGTISTCPVSSTRSPCSATTHGVPQIYADTADDLFFAQGYVQAQDRFYEMDVRRHMTVRAALGDVRRGHPRGRQGRPHAGLAPGRGAGADPARARRRRSYLEAFSAGVNAYLDDRSPGELSLEYTLLAVGGLDYRVEEWTPVDSVAWLKAMAWDLRGNMQDEIDRAMASTHARRRADRRALPAVPLRRSGSRSSRAAPSSAAQFARGPGRCTPVRRGAPLPAARCSTQLAALDRRRRRRCRPWSARGDGVGSNAWVVDGDALDDRRSRSWPTTRTSRRRCRASGTRWACTAPRSRRRLPVRRRRLHLRRLPRRGHRPQPADRLGLHQPRSRRHRPLPRGGRRRALPARQAVGAVRAPAGDDRGRRARTRSRSPCAPRCTARCSPTSSPTYASVGANAPVPGSVAGPRRRLRRRPGVDRAAAVADRRGGLRDRPGDRLGRVPRGRPALRGAQPEHGVRRPRPATSATRRRVASRSAGRPTTATTRAPGWDKRYDWTGEYVPFDELPTVLDPDEGFIVTANQAPVGPGYPYDLGDAWDYGYRSQRIPTCWRRRARSASTT